PRRGYSCPRRRQVKSMRCARGERARVLLGNRARRPMQDPKAKVREPDPDITEAFRIWAASTRSLEARLRAEAVIGAGQTPAARSRALRAACEVSERGAGAAGDADDRHAEARVIEALLALPAPVDVEGRARIRNRSSILRWLSITQDIVIAIRQDDSPSAQR